MHYYKFNIPDWNLATSHLTLEEEAIYFRLINYYYDTEQPIPAETQSVIRRLKLGSHSDMVGLILSEFFTLTEKGWCHFRCDEVIDEYHSKADSNRKNGIKGGRPKKNNNLDNNPEITQTVIETKPNNNPNITLTNNHKPITNKLINTQKTGKIKIDTPEGVSENVFQDFLRLRKELKAPVTETALAGLIREAKKAELNLQQVLEICCQNGWRGFKADWVKSNEAIREKNRSTITEADIAKAARPGETRDQVWRRLMSAKA